MDASRIQGAPPAHGMCGTAGLVLISAFLLLAPARLLIASDSYPADRHWNLFTPEQDTRLGRELGAWVEANAFLSGDTRSQQAISVVGARLLAVSPVAVPEPGFQLLATTEPYALGLPGGRIYVGTALVALCANEASLAGALAHELAHVALRHTTRKLSNARRFRVHAALVSAEHGKATLLEALQAIELDVVPGAPLMRYTTGEELEAFAFATRLLARAAYPPGSAADFDRHLRATGSKRAMRYLERHPASGDIPPDGSSPKIPMAAERSLSAGSWRHLVLAAAQASANAGPLDALLAWTPPVNQPIPARTRERFINRSYAFDYPADWMPGKPGFDETIEIAPRGGRAQLAGQPAQLVIGLLAGTLEPVDGDLTGSETLSRHLATLRPGLRESPAPEVPGADLRGLEQRSLAGVSPQGGDERAWAFSRRLPERVFYLLLIAPANEFPNYQTEFKAIAASVDLQGHPRAGRVDVSSARAAPRSDPSTNWERLR